MKYLFGILRSTMLMGFILCCLQITAESKLQGIPIGCESVDYGSGYQLQEYAFDGDLDTYYASNARSYTWVGLDLGTEHVISKIGFCPRKNYAVRAQLGLFEGANREDFLDAMPLYLIPDQPADNQMTYVNVDVSRGFRYVRYVGPADVRCNIAELEFYGTPGTGTDERFYQLTNLPTLSIHTYTGAEVTSKDYELEANVTITYDGCRIQEYPILVRGRGNASWNFPKKPMRIKFNDGKSHHMLKDSPLESPAKAKKWTLINNYGDKTLMRNMIAFEMSRRLDMPYTPYCQPVDVILNGEYKGCYQLCDQIGVDPDRVPVTEMTPDDDSGAALTGGYLVEVDAYATNEVSWFSSNKGIPVTIKSPSADEITASQYNYIRGYFNLMEQRLWADDYTDETNGYRSILDVESFLKRFIVSEFSGNTDGYWSTYMYKDREEDRFTIAPVWDYDLAFDNDSRIYPVCENLDWNYRSRGSTANGMDHFVSRVLSDPYADARLKEIWTDMRQSGAFSEDDLLAFVDSMAQVLDASQRLNFVRWPILNEIVHMNVMARGSYEAEVDVVRHFIPERISWIDKFLSDEHPEVPENGTFEISTAEELMAFASQVNAGATASQGYLTADIDMSGFCDGFVPIGTQANPFKGLFNGQGHTIRNLCINGGDYFGIFGAVTGGVTIRDFTLDSNSSIYGGTYVGIVGASIGTGIVTLEKIGNEATIFGTRNAAAIIGCNMNTSATFEIRNCYNKGEITSAIGEGGAISGWVGDNARITGCWNIGEVYGTEWHEEFARFGSNLTTERCYSNSGYQVGWLDEAQLVSGELCYLLNDGDTENGAWHQTLGEDDCPVLEASHGKVYIQSPLHCNGVPYESGNGFTNNVTDVQRDEHQFTDCICDYCGAVDEHFAEKDDRGYYMIASAMDLNVFITYANTVDHTASAVLTDDIDFTAYGNQMLGNDKHFAGTFDGAGHCITIYFYDCGETAGFFRNLDGTVMDLTLSGDIYTSQKFAGGICGQMYGARLLRCHSRVNIHSRVYGDGTHGGLTAIVNNNNGICEIESCLFSGTISGSGTDCCGGLVGWATDQVYLQNCLMMGDITIGTHGSDILCRHNSNMFGQNNYYLTDWRADTYPLRECYETTPEDMADGTLLAQLNKYVQNWKQTIPADPHPLPYIEYPVTQIIDMAEGWNWISHSMKETIPAGSIMDMVSIVRSQTEESFLDEEYGWVGEVTSLLPLTAYKVKSDQGGSATLCGFEYDLTEPVSLHRGWNWIGVPALTDIEEGELELIGYNPGLLDQIVGREGFVQYDGASWKGSLLQLCPGRGYMLYAHEEQTLQWTVLGRRALRQAGSESRHAVVGLQNDIAIGHAYPNVMNAIVTANASDGTEICAYAGTECRARGILQDGICYLTIFGEGGERLTFSISDGYQEQEADQSATFRSLDMLGTNARPYILTFDTETDIAEAPKAEEGHNTYYSVDGRKANRLGKGIYIRRTMRGDGSVTTTKQGIR